jgi:hypothetical protein
LEKVEERDEKQPDDNPEGEVLAEVIHDERLSYKLGIAPPRLPLREPDPRRFSLDLQIRREPC